MGPAVSDTEGAPLREKEIFGPRGSTGGGSGAGSAGLGQERKKSAKNNTKEVKSSLIAHPGRPFPALRSYSAAITVYQFLIIARFFDNANISMIIVICSIKRPIMF